MNNYTTITSDKSKKTALILCSIGLVGFGGLHDFYLGNFGKGMIKLLTVNWFILGTLIDLLKIASGSYKDNSGQPLRK